MATLKKQPGKKYGNTVMKKILFFVAYLLTAQAMAVISVQDDAGSTVVLPQPAKRVVSLAPHVTELLFAAGGGDRIVGTVEWSDYPPEALNIARVGDHNRIDIERMLSLKPDLLVVWLHGSAARQIEPLRQLGIPFFYSDPNKLDDISGTLLRLGQLMGTETQAQKVAAEVRRQLSQLAAKYRDRPLVRVFYQVWDQPMYTLNGKGIVSDAIRLCGGENVFAKLPLKAPVVNVEAVLAENPEVIISGDRRNKTASGLDIWKPYTTMLAVRRGNLFTVDADQMNRASPRTIIAATDLCEKLEQARARRGDRP